MPNRRRSDLLKRYGMSLVVLGAAITVVILLSEDFLTVASVPVLTRQVTTNGIVAAGMTLVILSGGIDLSVGGVIALAAAVSAGVLASTNSLGLAIAAALLVGGAVGMVNGVLVSYPRLPPFLVTLATMTIARGLTQVYTGGTPLPGDHPGYAFIGEGSLGPVPLTVVLIATIYVVLYMVMTKHRFGRLIYAIGGNEVACRLSGIKVERVKTMVYVLAGMLAGVAAVVLTARAGSPQPTVATGYELDAIAAVMLGGTSLRGGQGHVVGTLVGAVVVGVLAHGLHLLAISPFYQDVAKGLVILMALLADGLLLGTNRGGVTPLSVE